MLQEKPKPYIGISGIPNDIHIASEIGQMLVPHDLPTHRWMTGYNVAENALRWKKPLNPNSPSLESLPDLLNQTRNSGFNSIHYFTRNPSTVSSQINALLTRTGIHEHNPSIGIQLNNHWPDPKEVIQIKNYFPDVVLVLQIGPKALLESDGRIVGKIAEYSEAVDYLLIDPSMGKGKPIDIQRASSLYGRLMENYPNISVIFAGGIDPDNMEAMVEEMVAIVGTKNFGIDAQSGLVAHKTSDHQQIDIEKTRRYLKRAVEIFNKNSLT